MNIPRLLPLIGVALAGVLAVNVLGGARDLPAMFSAAKAMAEGVAATDTKAAKGKGAKPAKDAAAAPAPASDAPPLPPGQSLVPAPALAVCAPGSADLAKSAGLSPAELTVLQNLGARRGQIDQQAKDIDTQTQLLAAAEAKLDAKMKAMAGLKDQIQALMGQADQKTQTEIDRLVVVYSKMPAKNAAPVMTVLDDKVRVPVAASMKPAVLAAILKEMQPLEAKKLTELLAHRFANVQQLADAAKAPPAAAPAPAAPPAKPGDKTKPAATAKADADPADANVDDAPKAKAKPKAKPVKLAKRAPPKKKPAKAKPPVEDAKATTGPKPYTEVKDPPAKVAAPATTAPAKSS